MCGSPHIKKDCDIHPEERAKAFQTVCDIWVIHRNASGQCCKRDNVPQTDNASRQSQNGEQIHLKLTKAARGSKVYLSEKIQVEQIKKTSIWHTNF